MKLKFLSCPGSCKLGLVNVTQVEGPGCSLMTPASQRPYSFKIALYTVKDPNLSMYKMKLIPTL